MRVKLFYQCEHCVHYIQHYNISEDRIYKVGCGHCKCRDKNLKPSLRDCKYFTQRTEKEQTKEKEQHSLKVLKEIEKTLKHLKLYLNRREQEQKIDSCLKDKIQ